MRRGSRARIRRIAAIPCFVLAPLLWIHGCTAWHGQPVDTLEGAGRFAVAFLPLAVLLIAGFCLWTPVPKR
jgi:hypothetical protein